MGAITLRIHPHADIKWDKLADLAGTGIQVETAEEPMGLAMIDPDGEVNVYVFTGPGKENLIRQLTGGVIVP